MSTRLYTFSERYIHINTKYIKLNYKIAFIFFNGTVVESCIYLVYILVLKHSLMNFRNLNLTKLIAVTNYKIKNVTNFSKYKENLLKVQSTFVFSRLMYSSIRYSS